MKAVQELSVNKAVVLRFNKELMEDCNTEALEKLVADDFINHTAAGTVAKDRQGLMRFITLLHTGFSDFRVEIHEQVEEGDVVASRKTIYARHTGEIMGHAPTGKVVEFKVMDFVRLREGKYIEHWGQNNVMQVIGTL
ncbi:ester cyclase [Arachidicoccus terrestris]|uniref:ester cyclase n=1 Tax=Arachidicoccus terrestris TaxID=2875539 RepID=UPI001CC502C6|nr:ester cyclase [Arachidicoccus terrestris]UAY55581.1 ester cyclase [Arachidicoccus terrestris]